MTTSKRAKPTKVLAKKSSKKSINSSTENLKASTKKTSTPKQAADHYWALAGHPNSIQQIGLGHQLKLIQNVNIREKGPILGMHLSPDGSILATFSCTGCIKLWEVDSWGLIQDLRDQKEPNIDEFYVGRFTPDGDHIIVGGKLKDRKRWSHEDDDNHILACPLKIFNITSGEVVSRLEGHAEEVLCIKAAVFNEKNYYVSTSQDGYIIRWEMDDDWITLIDSVRFEDGKTCMAFTVGFVPNTGNKYVLAACDEHIRLYDFEKAELLQTFQDIYSSYCDCGKFVDCLDMPSNEKEAYFLTRGVELLDVENNTVASRPNTCTLHKLVYPSKKGGKFALEEVRRFSHDGYLANSWLMKITSNGRYLLAPTLSGHVYIFNLLSGQVTGILKDHEDREIRDMLFHPTKKLLFTAGDDGCVKVYTQ